MQCKPPSWFADKLKHLAQTGKLDLSGEAFDDLSFVGSRPTMKHIDLSFTPIQTIEGLQLQPKLDTLIADSSELVNFKNFRAVQKISSISIKNTPASHLPNFKLSLLIVIGPTLRVINGQYISSKLREKAKQYPPIASDLINCGWMAEYPCPEESEMDKICQKYGLADFDDDPDDIPESFVQQNPIDLEQAVDYYTSIHKKVIEQAHQQIKNASLDFEEFHLPPIERDPLGNEENSFLSGLEADIGINLCDKVQILLHHHGYKVDPKNRVESMIVILSKLLEIDSHDTFEEEEEEEEEEKVEENFKINKLSKNKQTDKKLIESKRNENKVIKRNANGRQDETNSNEENKQIKTVQNKKNQNEPNENVKQVEKKSNQRKNKESNQLVEKIPNKKIGNKRNNRHEDEIIMQADFDDYYENDYNDHLDSYNDNSNSFENKFNINNDDDYEYDDFQESIHFSKDIQKYSKIKSSSNEKVKITKKNAYNNVSIDSNKDDYNYESLKEQEEEGSDINVSDYIRIEYAYDFSNKKKANRDNDSENTEKEIDINFDSITKEQMNTSGIDGQFFELANHCSSQSDIRELQDGEDANWNQFLAQLKNEP